MPAVQPSSPAHATGTLAGLVSTIAQTFAGAKTFLATVIASAGVQVGSIFNTNGSGASDVVMKVGTTVADGSVNAAAKLVSVRSGLGGTEVEHLFAAKNGWLYGGQGAAGLQLWSTGARLEYGTASFTVTSIYGAFLGAGPMLVESTQADGADRTVVYGNCRSAWTTLSSNLLYLQNDEQDRVRVNPFGMFRVYGSDSTASPGAATINRPIGKSAIAAGAASVVITNSLVSTASHVIITPHARDATCKELVAELAAGSFTVSGTANATATLPFSWEVKGLL